MISGPRRRSGTGRKAGSVDGHHCRWRRLEGETSACAGSPRAAPSGSRASALATIGGNLRDHGVGPATTLRIKTASTRQFVLEQYTRASRVRLCLRKFAPTRRGGSAVPPRSWGNPEASVFPHVIRERMRASLLALLLACLAIAIRILVPSGYMLVPGAQAGAAMIAPCTGVSAPSVQAHPGHATVHQPAHDGRKPAKPAPDHACVFSGFHAGAAVEPIVFVATMAWTTMQPALERTAQTPAYRVGVIRPPPTGPPGSA